jgi:hypothetical protein
VRPVPRNLLKALRKFNSDTFDYTGPSIFVSFEGTHSERQAQLHMRGKRPPWDRAIDITPAYGARKGGLARPRE